MTSGRRTGRAWTKHTRNPATDPALVLAELRQRELLDLEHCRIAWEAAEDPLAVTVAVTHAGLPDWLTDALLGLLIQEAGAAGGGMLRGLWRRRLSAADSAERSAAVALAVLAERRRPEFVDLERCRVGWEAAADPLAVTVAVTDAGLPDWLTNGLLMLLIQEAHTDGAGRLRRLWRRRRLAAASAERAGMVALARATTAAELAETINGAPDATAAERDDAVAFAQADPEARLTWEQAREWAEPKTRERYGVLSQVSPEMMAKAFRTVCRGLTNRGAYYRAPAGFNARVDLALERQFAMMKRALDSPSGAQQE